MAKKTSKELHEAYLKKYNLLKTKEVIEELKEETTYPINKKSK